MKLHELNAAPGYSTVGSGLVQSTLSVTILPICIELIADAISEGLYVVETPFFERIAFAMAVNTSVKADIAYPPLEICI